MAWKLSKANRKKLDLPDYLPEIDGKKRKRSGGKKGWRKHRKNALKRLGFDSYREYLDSDLWKGIRDRVLKKQPQCHGCFRPATQVHHSDYAPETLSGEDTSGLYATCGSCHLRGHKPDDETFRTPGRTTAAIERRRKAKIWFGLGFADDRRLQTDRDWIEWHWWRRVGHLDVRTQR